MLLRKNIKKYAAALLALGVLFSGAEAKAQSQTVDDTTATIILANTFTFAQTTPMHFGTMVMKSHASDQSTMVLTPLGVGTATIVGDSSIVDVNITARTEGVYDITGAAISTAINVSYGTYVALTCALCVASPPNIGVGSATNTGGAIITTSASGAFTMAVGATLTTAASAQAYEDGVYAGSFNITLAY